MFKVISVVSKKSYDNLMIARKVTALGLQRVNKIVLGVLFIRYHTIILWVEGV